VIFRVGDAAQFPAASLFQVVVFCSVACDGVFMKRRSGSICSEERAAVISKDAFALPAILDITKAQELRGHMVDRLNVGPLVVDASAVDRVSTPCIQVLLAAARSADGAGTSFRIADASEALRAALVDLGLQTVFKHWMV
jgi:anti-anti-sigma regulatory factor